MTTFDDREKAFEGKFAYQENMDFAVEARLTKLFGLWAAEKLGLDDADAQTYAAQLVAENLKEPGLDDVLRAVRKDFDAKGIEISDHMLHVELDKATVEAKRQLMSGKK